jgi:hypothetical protein
MYTAVINLKNIKAEQINEDWLYNFLKINFKRVDENITPLKILSLLGISIDDQFKSKFLIKKIKLTLSSMEKSGLLFTKEYAHGTLGIREVSYKKKYKYLIRVSHSNLHQLWI